MRLSNVRFSHLAVTFVILALFLFMRLYRLPQTLEFYSDIGRDHYTLLNWRQTGKPPLLGPSTSFLPLNQSPWYFYLLFPLFLISGSSAYTSIATLLLLYSVFYLAGTYIYRDNQTARRMLWVTMTFISVHALFVEQHRSPWNPSFVTPFLLVSICALLFPEGKEKMRIGAFALGIVTAVGMSYSIVPTAVVLILTAFVRFRKNLLWLFGALFAASLLIFLPLLLSELRHGFFFLNRLILERGGDFTPHQNLMTKSRSMLMSIFWGRNANLRALLWPLLVIGLSSFFVYFFEDKEDYKKLYRTLLILLSSTFILTLVAPFILNAHYVYGILTLLLCLIGIMRKRFILLLLILLLPFWFSKDAMGSTLFRPIRRSISDLEKCAKIVCDREKHPIFVADSAWHDYHFAPDHLFFMNKAGCSAKDITGNPGFAQRMAVVIDQGSFTFGKSSFNELTLFGNATPSASYQCPAGIRVEMLQQL